MADFCAQCAEEHGFPEGGDFKFDRGKPLPPSHGWVELCEGCGPILVDAEGRCMGDCYEGHSGTPKVDPRSDVYSFIKRIP